MEMAILMQDAAGTPKVSVDEAATIASEFLGQSGGTSLSKSLAAPKCDVYLRKHTSLKKAASDESDTLFYLFNYGEDNGYAVVSADVRVPQPVLAYSDEGSIILDTDNPGLSIFYDLAEQYVDESIAELEESRDSLEAELDSKLFGKYTDTTKTSLSKTKTFVRKFKIPYEIINTWVTTYHIDPLLKTTWSQESPFNNLMPTCPKHGGHYPAGCVTIATGQLMAYWKWPSTVNGISINSVRNSSSKYDLDRAKFIKYLADNLDIEYGCDNSGNHFGSADPEKVVLPLLNKFGYHTYKFSDYYVNGIVYSLNEQKPVYIRGRNQNDEGHSWLIDGYVCKINNREQTNYYVSIYDVDGQQVSEVDTVVSSVHVYQEYYVHCNWGWGGTDDGYYYNGVFDNSGHYNCTWNSSGEYQMQYQSDSNKGDVYNTRLRIADFISSN